MSSLNLGKRRKMNRFVIARTLPYIILSNWFVISITIIMVIVCIA